MRKTILMIVLLTLIGISNSNAMTIPIETIGYAYSDGAWDPTGPGELNISRGNADGLAYRFILNESYDISGIFGSLTGVDGALTGAPEPGNAQFFLLGGSKCPAGNCSSGYVPQTASYRDNPDQLYKSQYFEVPLTEKILGDPVEGTWYGESDLHVNLPAGDYWFGARGGANDGYIRVSDYRLEGNVAPEPATIWLFGMGLLGLARKKIRK